MKKYVILLMIMLFIYGCTSKEEKAVNLLKSENVEIDKDWHLELLEDTMHYQVFTDSACLYLACSYFRDREKYYRYVDLLSEKSRQLSDYIAYDRLFNKLFWECNDLEKSIYACEALMDESARLVLSSYELYKDEPANYYFICGKKMYFVDENVDSIIGTIDISSSEVLYVLDHIHRIKVKDDE